MKIVRHISVGGRAEARRARALAMQLGIEGLGGFAPSEVPIDAFTTETTDERVFNQLVAKMRTEGLEPHISYQPMYTEGEIKAAQYVAISYEGMAVEIDLEKRCRQSIGGCGNCGSLAELTGAFVLEEDPEPHGELVCTTSEEIIVSPRLSEALGCIPGISNRLVRIKSQFGQYWSILLVKPTLPKLDASSLGVVQETPCAVCGRDGYGIDNEESYWRYRYSVVEMKRRKPESPIEGTFELFGQSAREEYGVYPAMPLLVVNREVADVLLRSQLCNVRMDPVELV